MKRVQERGSRDGYDREEWYAFSGGIWCGGPVWCDLPYIETTMSDEIVGTDVEVSTDDQRIILNKVNTAVLAFTVLYHFPDSDARAPKRQEDYSDILTPSLQEVSMCRPPYMPHIRRCSYSFFCKPRLYSLTSQAIV